MRIWVQFLFSWVFVLVSSCALLGGGDSGLNRASSYELDIPETWTALKSKGESDRAYRLSSGNLVSVASSCKKNFTSSLRVLTQQLLIGTRQRVVFTEKPVAIDNGTGLFTSLKARTDGKLVYLGVLVVKKHGCVFDFSLLGSDPLSQNDISTFIRFAKSLKYGSN